MAKRPIGCRPYLAPIPIVLVGAVVDGRPNFATVGDCAVLGLRPALLAISLAVSHHTTRGVLAEGAFSVNIPTESMVALVDHFGTASGRDIDKGALLASTPGPETEAPLAEACPISIECRVHSLVEIEHRRIFISHVVQTHVDAAFLSGSPGHLTVAPLNEIRPILYALDGQYYGVGGRIGTSHEIGRSLDRLRTA